MKNKLTFDEARFEIKSHLVDFLRESGIKEGGKNFFTSFYDDSTDTKASLHILVGNRGDIMYHDFSTNRSGDIFMANHIINKAPIIGKEFITDNMQVLAKKYGIEFESKPMSEDDAKLYKIKGLYRLIRDISLSNLLKAIKTDNLDKSVKDYMESKDIYDEASIKRYQLGWIPDWESFKKEIIAFGITPEYMSKEVGIEKYIFNPNNLLFNVLDYKNSVKGYVARNCYFSVADKQGGKYYNIENNIWYNKGSMLYNMNNAYNKKKNGYMGSMYICEGQTDAIALDKIGLKTVAVGSTNFNSDHITVLQSIDESDIVFILDGDAAGKRATTKILFEVLSGVKAFKVRVVELPEGEDPSSFIHKFGKEALLTLPHKTAFEYKLEILRATSDLRGHDLANNIIPFIVNEPSEIEKDAMCGVAADACGLPIEIIRKEVNRISNEVEIRIGIERDAIIDNAIKLLKLSPKDAGITLQSAYRQLNNLHVDQNGDVYSQEESLNELMLIKEQGEILNSSASVRLLAQPKTQKTFDGSMVGAMIILGGQPNSGKSTMFYNWIKSMLDFGYVSDIGWDQNLSEDPNNICIFLHTVDDNSKQVVPKIVTILANEFYDRMTIRDVTNIHGIEVDEKLKMRAREMAYNKLRGWMKEGRLFIKDMSYGSRLSDGLRFVREFKTRYPDRQMVYMVDNLYNLSDYQEITDEKIRIGKIANGLNDMAGTEDLITFATVEYRKSSNISDSTSSFALNELIKETKSLEYRAKWIGHLLNDLYMNPESTALFFYDNAIPREERRIENRSPVVLLRVSKNKISAHKPTIPFLFFHERAIQVELSKYHLPYLQNELVNAIRKYLIRDDEVIESRFSEDYDFIRNVRKDNETFS